MRLRYPHALLFILLFTIVSAHAEPTLPSEPTAPNFDIAGSSDYHLIDRFPGSFIIDYQPSVFDTYEIPMGIQILKRGVTANRFTLENSRKIEGSFTGLRYVAPEGKAPLEVFNGYETALREAGFDILFACEGRDCGDYFKEVVYDRDGDIDYLLAGRDQRFLTARLAGDDNDIYATLYTIAHEHIIARYKNRTITQLEFIELHDNEDHHKIVNDTILAERLSEHGHVVVPGIYFKVERAELKPESKQAIEEIAEVLLSIPTLKLYIVGHTGIGGTLTFKRELSKKRAEALREILINNYGILPGRLLAEGAGFLAPIASSRNKEGAEMNERIELIEWLVK